MEAKRLTKKAVVDAAVVRMVSQMLLIMEKERAARARLFCDEEKVVYVVFDGGLPRERMYPPLSLFDACVGRLRRLAKMPLNRERGDKTIKEGKFYLKFNGGEKKQRFLIKLSQPENGEHEEVEILLQA